MNTEYKKLLFESGTTVTYSMLQGYLTLFESPHAVVHDSSNKELLLDFFAEKDGEMRPDGHIHDWIEYMGDLIEGKPVEDFYDQSFKLSSDDIDRVVGELNGSPILTNMIKLELSKNPWKSKYLPIGFLSNLFDLGHN